MCQNCSKELAKTYDPKGIEGRLYKKWEDNGYFHAEVDRSKKPFTIVMPPPNITGQLHMGHALDNTMQDILIRYKRMQGYNALWQPGTDHASIATEVKVIENLKKQGIDKHDLGREGFLEKCYEWKDEYGNRIINQLKKMGSSADWQRERFTMDKGCSDAVLEVFVKLYEKGLIYKGSRIVNWCPVCKTSISDAEVEHEEQDGFFWHINYPVVGEEGRFVEIATTRPETLFGDTAVAVNPDDERYKDIVGKMLKLPMTDREIPVIADPYVDKEFGTGCVKITPAHDPNDFEVGQRHNLPIVRVFTYDGRMTGAKEKAENDALFASGKATVGEPRVIDCGKYAGMTAMEARKAIVKDLEAGGYLKRVEPLAHEVGTCYRCHTTIEPMVSKQWFVKMAPLAKPAVECVRNGEVRFVPERFAKNYMTWMENIRDWCISRQLWWGHRIPAWYCDDCGEVIVARETPTVCPKCGCTHLAQDEDVLDTWFSSALWPFSTLGWPEQTADLSYFYPTSVLVTGYDIIFFWVARMIFSGIEQMGKPPFHTVLIHGLVRDAQGRKMSKSLGNGVDPLEIIDQYGADALRFSLVMGVSPGNDMRFSTDKVESARNFANKIWNASRFVLMNMGDEAETLEGKTLCAADQWILTRLNDTIREVSAHFEDYDLGLAAQKIYDFAWSEFCDWYIELAKVSLNGEGRAATLAVLRHVLICLLKMLHPFMPFITDEVYRHIPGTEGTIMLSDWPKVDDAMNFPQEAREMEGVMDVIRAVRNLRAEMNVSVGRRAHLIVRPKAGWEHAMAGAGEYFGRLAWASGMQLLTQDEEAPAKTVSAVSEAAELFIPLGDLVDVAKETARLTKERDSVQRDIERGEAKLNNPGFTGKAPAQLVEQEREKLAVARDKLAKLNARIEDLANM